MCQTEPKFTDRSHRGDEIPQVAGFAHVAVCPQLVAAENVLLRIRRAEDGDWNHSQNWIALDLGQHRAAVFSGETQVKNYEVGNEGAGVFAFAAQECNR